MTEPTSLQTIFQRGGIELKVQSTFGSNYTFLAEIPYENQPNPTVYQPKNPWRRLFDKNDSSH